MFTRAGIFFLALLIAAPGRADEGDIADFEELDLEELLDVVFTAARHEQDIGNSPSAIWVITREDIETSGATSIPDLLRMVPGMDVILMSQMFTAVSTRLPWTDENNVFLILVDGREANIELLGFVFWDIIPVTLDEVERIEVIRGPASSLYGTNALSGVINIQTRAVSQETSGWARVSSGEVGTLGVGARVSTTVGGWGLSASAVLDRAGTFSDPAIVGKRAYRLRSVVERRWSESRRLRLDAGLSYLGGNTTSAMGAFTGNMIGMAVQLVYEHGDLRGQLYWVGGAAELDLDASLDYGEVHLAEINPISIEGHMVDGEVQWTLPELWKPMLVIVGGMVRIYWADSDNVLDGVNYADITSPRYHQPGLSHFEWRTGAFAHLELEPAEFLTVTGGLRFDWNSETGEFFSPRVAAVFRPAPKHFVRLGVARAFRKPSFSETRIHVMVDFPPDSPLQGGDQENFREFMSRVLGNDHLGNEQLWSFEGGYLVRLLEDRLSLSFDLYYTLYMDQVALLTDILTNSQGLPDLDNSTIQFVNIGTNIGTWGTELSARFRLSRSVSLQASWTHREVRDHDTGAAHDTSPKNLIVLGGRFRSPVGILGSLYLFSRSEFWDRFMTSPSGWFEPRLQIHLDDVLLVLGKIGWQWQPAPGVDLEAGIKLFLPVSPFSGSLFRYRERGGVLTSSGGNYGGDNLCRVVTGYLQGSF
jgi:outer membrane receptor protein involved in Fe transport